MKKLKAFTLIELLVVIVIISILATIVIVNVSSSRKMARDSRRRSDVLSIKNGLELYNQKHTKYPTAAEYSTVLVSEGFLPSMPHDPQFDPADHPDYTYTEYPNNDGYGIEVTWDDSTTNPPCVTGVNFTLAAGQAKCDF